MEVVIPFDIFNYENLRFQFEQRNSKVINISYSDENCLVDNVFIGLKGDNTNEINSMISNTCINILTAYKIFRKRSSNEIIELYAPPIQNSVLKQMKGKIVLEIIYIWEHCMEIGINYTVRFADARSESESVL